MSEFELEKRLRERDYHEKTIKAESDEFETEAEASADSIDKMNDALDDLKDEVEDEGGEIVSYDSPSEECEEEGGLFVCTNETNVVYWLPSERDTDARGARAGVIIDIGKKLDKSALAALQKKFPLKYWFDSTTKITEKVIGVDYRELMVFQAENDKGEAEFEIEKTFGGFQAKTWTIDNCGLPQREIKRTIIEKTIEGHSASFTKTYKSIKGITADFKIKLGKYGEIGGGYEAKVELTETTKTEQDYTVSYEEREEYEILLKENHHNVVNLRIETLLERWRFTVKGYIAGYVRPKILTNKDGQFDNIQMGDWINLEELLATPERTFDFEGYIDVPKVHHIEERDDTPCSS